MPRFIVETAHTAESCKLVIREVHSLGFLHHFEWGCDAGIHAGWAFIEAGSEQEALFSIPLMVRPQARAVRVVKFSEENFERLHAEP